MRTAKEKEALKALSLKVSKVCKYSGYCHPIYNGWFRTSQYVKVRDGTKVAVDIFRPVDNGNLVTDPLLVI